MLGFRYSELWHRAIWKRDSKILWKQRDYIPPKYELSLSCFHLALWSPYYRFVLFFSIYRVINAVSYFWSKSARNVRAIVDFPPQWLGFNIESGHVGFVVDKVTLGAGFRVVFRVSLSVFTPPTATQSSSSSSSSGYGIIGPVVAYVPSGSSL
jgi:hypothetical protein